MSKRNREREDRERGKIGKEKGGIERREAEAKGKQSQSDGGKKRGRERERKRERGGGGLRAFLA